MYLSLHISDLKLGLSHTVSEINGDLDRKTRLMALPGGVIRLMAYIQSTNIFDTVSPLDRQAYQYCMSICSCVSSPYLFLHLTDYFFQVDVVLSVRGCLHSGLC